MNGPTTDEADRLDAWLEATARSDQRAFGRVYDAIAEPVFGLVRRILRDPARSEEVTQELFVQVWQTAHRYDPARGRAKNWILTLAHRRAVDAARHDRRARDRDTRYARTGVRDFDQVEEEVWTRLEHEQVRQCLGILTDLQREAIDLAYYQGYTYSQVARLLEANPATVKTRMRAGLTRLGDCLGRSA